MFGALGLSLCLLLTLSLLPRIVGGLLGRGDREPGGWATGLDYVPEIVWDPGEPDAVTVNGESEEEEEGDAESEEPDLLLEETDEESSDSPSAQPADGGDLPPAGEQQPAAPAAEAAAGSGEPTTEGRRSPRILYQEWPRQELLADLDRSGAFRFRLRVEADGSVSDWELIETFDCSFCREEAERIVRSLRFAPGKLDGRPVACWVPYQIEFKRGRK